jgi:hypothetical protein
MPGSARGSAREEAERLVVTVLASVASGSGRGPDWGRLGGGLASVLRTAGDRLGDLGGVAGDEERTGEHPDGDRTAGDNTGRDESGGPGRDNPGRDNPGRDNPGRDNPGRGGTGGGSRRADGGRQAGGHWATGSPECCVCPVCKAIAAARDPKPETAARLAGSAGDFATGVAHLMRAVSALTPRSEKPRRTSRPAQSRPGNADQTWSTATRRAEPSNTADTSWAAATNAGGQTADGEDGKEGRGAGTDAWSAATTTSAATVAAEHAAELRARREAAQQAAAEAQRRVAEAAEQARARREAEQERATREARPEQGVQETGDTAGGAARQGRTPQRFDVWAAATADAGIAPVTPPTTVDHDVAGHDSGTGDAGDDARP